MTMARTLIMVILAAPVVLGITVMIYMLFYRRKINKRLAEGITDGRSMMSPTAFFIITLICVSAAVFVIVTAISFFMLSNYKSSGTSRDGFDGAMLVNMSTIYEEDLENSPFEGYKTGDDIAGYTRHTQNNGDLTFYYYTVNNNMQGVLPRLIVATDTACDTSGTERGFIIRAEQGNKEIHFNGSGEYCMYAIDCDTFEGIISIEEYYFDDKQNDGVHDPYELSDSAEVKGVLELDMSYPIPEE